MKPSTHIYKHINKLIPMRLTYSNAILYKSKLSQFSFHKRRVCVGTHAAINHDLFTSASDKADPIGTQKKDRWVVPRLNHRLSHGGPKKCWRQGSGDRPPAEQGNARQPRETKRDQQKWARWPVTSESNPGRFFGCGEATPPCPRTPAAWHWGDRPRESWKHVSLRAANQGNQKSGVSPSPPHSPIPSHNHTTEYSWF